jgi:hypothetical protein
MCLGGPLDRQWLDVPDEMRTVQVSAPQPIAFSTTSKVSSAMAWRPELYDRVHVVAGKDMMMPAGRQQWSVLAHAGMGMRERNAMLARDDRPVVDGPRDRLATLLIRDQHRWTPGGLR